MKGVRKDLPMLLDESLHPLHLQKARKEYGVTPYPVTPHQLLQPAGKGEQAQGGQTKTLDKCLPEKTLSGLPNRKYTEVLDGTCVLHTGFDIILVYTPRQWLGVVRKALFLWLCLPHHNQDNIYRHIDVFCVMWAPEKLV